jgi:hypothetical protein
MRITGTVVSLEAASEFTDGKARATIKVRECGEAYHNKLTLPMDEGFDAKLGDEIEMEIPQMRKAKVGHGA